MATTVQVQRGFAEEIAVLVETAQQLGSLRCEGNRQDFEQILEAVGMDREEASSYFDLVIPRSNQALEWDNPKVKSNTDMADAFGISLHNGDGQPPRNWLLYRLFQLQFPGMFQARYSGRTHLRSADAKKNVPAGERVNSDHRVVYFDKMPVEQKGKEANPIAIWRVIRGCEPAKFRAEVLRVAAPLKLALGEELGTAMADMLFGLQMLVPPEPVAKLLAGLLEKGKCGEEIMFAGVFCPDYAYEQTGNPHIPYRYTFDGVGEGVGLVAQQFARIIPDLSRFFTDLGIAHRFVVGIGDFEADSEAVLQRVGLSREEFVRRCQCSLDAFRDYIPDDVPLTLELFSAVRGTERLQRYANEATRRMRDGDFGKMARIHLDLDEVIARIPGQYRTFYERWYGRNMDDETVRNIVFSQGGEYSAVARMYDEDLGPNVILLAGDRPEMNRFNAFYCLQPVLCAKRAY